VDSDLRFGWRGVGAVGGLIVMGVGIAGAADGQVGGPAAAVGSMIVGAAIVLVCMPKPVRRLALVLGAVAVVAVLIAARGV